MSLSLSDVNAAVSVCLYVSLSLDDCAPSDSLCVLVFYHLLYFLSRQLSESHHGYYLEIQHAPPRPSCCTTLPAPLLTQVIGVLISSDAV